MRCWYRAMAERKRARSPRLRAARRRQDAVETLDPRLTPIRQRPAGHSGEPARPLAGRLYEVVEPTAPLRRAPSPDAPLDTEALRGERVTVYETTEEGWAWGQLALDGYVGYLPAAALRDPGPAPTHKVAALRTLVFPGPSVKLPPAEALPLGSRLAIARIEQPFAVIASGGYVPLRHLAAIDSAERDFVAVAERFLGTPYLWGGKTSLGLDCSGLVQVALTACGFPCPRDSDMQEAALGMPLAPARGLAKLQRGDLLFWKGHVAIVRDHATLVHANVLHMAVAVEPIAEAIGRIRAAGSEVTSVRRLALSRETQRRRADRRSPSERRRNA
jgi:cell wall-associated NlpC family hydrolase